MCREQNNCLQLSLSEGKYLRQKEDELEGVRLKIQTLHSEIEQEKEKTRQELKNQVAALAITGAEQILMREVDQAAHNEVLAKISQKL